MKTTQNGLTLIELMTTLAVAIVLLGVGVPMYQSLVANNRAVTQANSLVSAFTLARSEAVSRLTEVAVCARASDTSCGADWTNGWLVFVDNGSTAGSFESASEDMVRVFPALAAGSVLTESGSLSAVRFLPSGGASAAATFQSSLSGTTGSQTRCIRVNALGQVRTEKNTCS